MSAPGVRVSTGRIRVDAARAVDKLREYQLPDPTMWVLEVVRAAVHAKADRIRVLGDADDVWIAWENGTKIAADACARLFDELVDPAPAMERRHLRLLAAGVNTALGLSPRFVDVYTCDGSGESRAVRYTPQLLDRVDEDGTAHGLRQLGATARVAPPLAPERGVLVHMRRLPWLDAVPILVGFGEPAELAVVRRACEDIRTPLLVGKTEIGRARSHSDLLRAELGDGLDGFLAIVDPSFASHEAKLDVAELGVLLARYTLPIEGLSVAAAKVPIRLFVDAPRMPTNASRSAVRTGEPPIREAMARSRELLGPLLARLAASVEGEGIVPSRMRAAALSLIAAASAGESWRRRDLAALGEYGKAIVPLLDLPILRDAMGRARSVASFPPSAGARWVHFGSTPASKELEPWLGDVLWTAPGDPAAVLLGGWDAPPAKAMIARAKKLRRARDAWLTHAPKRTTIADRPGQLLRLPLRAPGVSLESCVPEGFFRRVKDLEGEVILCDPRSRHDSELRLSIGERAIETVTPVLDIPIVAAAQSAELRASEDYRAAERDEAFDALVTAVVAAAVVACEALALRMDGHHKPGDRAKAIARWVAKAEGDDRAALAKIVRGGVGLAVHVLAQQIQGDEPARTRRAAESLVRSKSPLLDLAAWPTIDGPWHSVRELLAAKRALAFVRRSVAKGALPRRPLYLLSERERAILEPLVHPLPLIDYSEVLSQTHRKAFAVPLRGVSLRIENDGHVAVISWGAPASALEIEHCGVRLAQKPYEPAFGTPCKIVVDDDRVVPDESWSALREQPPPYSTETWERALGQAYVDSWIGEPPPQLSMGAPTPQEATAARSALLRAIATAPVTPSEWLGETRIAKLRAIPFVSVLGKRGRFSLDEAASFAPEGPLAWVAVSDAANSAYPEFRPLRCTEEEAHAFARLLGRDIVSGEERLAQLRRAARRGVALERHRKKHEYDPSLGWSPMVSLEHPIAARVAFAPNPRDGSRIDVRIDKRPFVNIHLADGLPLRAVVDLSEKAADEDFAHLTKKATRALDGVLVRGARALLRSALRDAPTGFLATPRTRGLLIALSTHGQRAADRKLLSDLEKRPIFATVQGPYATLEEAASSRELSMAVWDDVWIGKSDTEPSSPLDAPIIQLPTNEEAQSELRALVHTIWRDRTVRDVTAQVERLQMERRVARGLVERPRLARVRDSRFRYPLEGLLAEEPLAAETLGMGEAALDDGEQSRLQLFDGGSVRHTIEANLVPRVIVAASTGRVRRRDMLDGPTRELLLDALRAVIARTMRKVVESVPGEQLPDWVRVALRTSCLFGGALHYERLASTPIFETTTGAWVSPHDLKAQEQRFGAVWWTADRKEKWIPLDEERIALQLSSSEAAQLLAWTRTMDATNELALDQTARRNRDRPPVANLAPSDEERAAAVAVIELVPEKGDPTSGFITVLAPGEGAQRALHAHRDRAPLGIVRDPAEWPAISRIDHPDLVPNRTWDAPIEDEACKMMQARVREAVRRQMLALLPWPEGAKPALVRVIEDRLHGMLWLTPDLSDGRLSWRDGAGEREVEIGLPLGGELWWDGPGASPTQIAGCIQPHYTQLLVSIAGRIPRDPSANDVAAAHVLRGLVYGRVHWAELPPIALPCFVPGPLELVGLLAHLDRGEKIPTATPDQSDALGGSSVPIFVDDGSLVARELASLIGAQRSELRTPTVRVHVPPRASELSPLEARLDALLATSILPGVTAARIVPGGRKKIVLDGSTLRIGANHPIVRHAQTQSDVDLLARLLLARCAGELRRVQRALGTAGELEAIVELLSL